MTERIINPYTEPISYRKLRIISDMLNYNAMVHGTGTRFEVGDTYLDFGQNWRWTTILADDDGHWGQWQVLSPREWKDIMSAETFSDFAKVADEIVNGDFFIA